VALVVSMAFVNFGMALPFLADAPATEFGASRKPSTLKNSVLVIPFIRRNSYLHSAQFSKVPYLSL
jgi:hypothetical protein